MRNFLILKFNTFSNLTTSRTLKKKIPSLPKRT